MSKFTGKSDFYDLCFSHYSPDDIFKSDVYIENNKIDFCNDVGLLVLYGPHIVSSMASTKNDDGSHSLTVYLTSRSYIDEREQDQLFWYWMTAKNYLLKCKDKDNESVLSKKWFYKYSDSLSDETMEKVFPLVENSEYKLTKLPKSLDESYAACQLERKIAADVLKPVHLPYWNDRRSELIHEFMSHSNKNYPVAREILKQINDFNKEKFE